MLLTIILADCSA